MVLFNDGNKHVYYCCWINYMSDGYAMTLPLPNLYKNACVMIEVYMPQCVWI